MCCSNWRRNRNMHVLSSIIIMSTWVSQKRLKIHVFLLNVRMCFVSCVFFFLVLNHFCALITCINSCCHRSCDFICTVHVHVSTCTWLCGGVSQCWRTRWRVSCALVYSCHGHRSRRLPTLAGRRNRRWLRRSPGRSRGRCVYDVTSTLRVVHLYF